ncbi:MAG: hypothetical protein JNK87_24480 [Bryobacterales bacterium]|nr:hypothetical protein [Bryobacterales bacterium]
MRRRLREYYQTEGAQDAWRIEIPPGGYLPILRSRDDAAREWRLICEGGEQGCAGG